MSNQAAISQHLRGFSLVEMAVVLVILGFILGALLLPLQAQREQLFRSQTLNTLETAKRALLGYVQTNGRLPCPSTATSNTDAGSLGQENPIGGTHNTTPPIPAVAGCNTAVGFLPAATLGIQPSDSSGFAIDGWNNRIRYAITTDNSSARVVNGSACGGDTAPDFTTAGNMGTVGIACLAPNLRVCSTATGITVSTCSGGTETNYLTNNAVAVVYSTGESGADGSGGIDEDANLNADAVFVSHDPTGSGSANGEFDHLVIWISPFVLYNAMLEAGQLH